MCCILYTVCECHSEYTCMYIHGCMRERERETRFSLSPFLPPSSLSLSLSLLSLNVYFPAVKILDKRHIIKEKKVQYVSREKEVLTKINHPFFVKLFFTFQDKENLCILPLICCPYGMQLGVDWSSRFSGIHKLVSFSDHN